MASLMEDLISVLNLEVDKYSILLELSKRKTPIIVKGDVNELQKITEEEQLAVEAVDELDKKRSELMKDIANVTNRDVESLKLKDLIVMMENRPEEHDALAVLQDKLKKTVGELKLINEQNGALIRQSLDMVEFNLALEKSIRTAPETNNYTKSAANAGSMLGSTFRSFDARQ